MLHIHAHRNSADEFEFPGRMGKRSTSYITEQAARNTKYRQALGTCERFAQGRYSVMRRPGVEPTTC